MLLSSEALVVFDLTHPLVLITDSSEYGVGAVLCHKIKAQERPISFASRTLSAPERKYFQLEKKALALIFRLKKFHDFLWGQHFSIITNNKPLLGIFSSDKPVPCMASGRIQRWALILQAYRFNIFHRSGSSLGTADALSRLPLPSQVDSVPVLGEWSTVVIFLDSSPITSSVLATKTKCDPVLSRVLRFCEVGCPQTNAEESLAPYFSRRDEMSIESKTFYDSSSGQGMAVSLCQVTQD